MKDDFSVLLEMRGDPYCWAREHSRAGGDILGFFCSYVPEELIYAAGVTPVRIIGYGSNGSAWGSHLQNYCCSLSRFVLDSVLSGELDFANGFLFCHSCDTMQRLSDIWRINTDFGFHWDLVAPTRMEGKAAFDYLCQELGALRRRLEGRFGPIDDKRISECMGIYSENRGLLRELYSLKRNNPDVISCTDLIWVVTASSLMDKALHTRLLRLLLNDLKSKDGSVVGGEKPVSLYGIGSVMNQWAFLEMLESSGGTFIDDDFCNGGRYVDRVEPGSGDPIEALAEQMMGGAECPCKHRSSSDRPAGLINRIKRSGAQGVVFYLLKYCDPYLFEYPHLKTKLDEIEIPSVLIEAEHGAESIGSMRTRVEALLETIKDSQARSF